MPGPTTAIGAIRVGGFESLADPPLPGDTYAYFRSGDRFRLTGPDWLTEITELPDNPFPDFVPEPSTLFILSSVLATSLLRR